MDSNLDQSKQLAENKPSILHNILDFFGSLLRYLFGSIIVYLVIEILESSVIVLFNLLNLDFQVSIITQIFLTICIMNFLIYFGRLADEKSSIVHSDNGESTSTPSEKNVRSDVGSIIFEFFYQCARRVDLKKIDDDWIFRILVVFTFILLILVFFEVSCLSPISFQVIEHGGEITEVLDGGTYLLEEIDSSIIVRAIERNTGKKPEMCWDWTSTWGTFNSDTDKCDVSIFLQNPEGKETTIIEVNALQCTIPFWKGWKRPHFSIIAPSEEHNGEK